MLIGITNTKPLVAYMVVIRGIKRWVLIVFHFLLSLVLLQGANRGQEIRMYFFTKIYSYFFLIIIYHIPNGPQSIISGHRNTEMFVKKYIFWTRLGSLWSVTGTQLKSLKLKKAANEKQLTPTLLLIPTITT